MKKILLLTLAVAAMFAVAACSPAAVPANVQPTVQSAQQTVAAGVNTAATAAAGAATQVSGAATTVATTVSGAATAVSGAATQAAPQNTATPPPPPNCAKLDSMPAAAKPGELGSPDKPIVITFVPSGDTGKITKAGTAIADCLTQMTGLTYNIEVGTSFASSVEAMGADKAQIGFLNTFSAVLGKERYGIEPALLVMRKYNTNPIDPDKAMKDQLEPFYKGQFIAKSDSGIKSFADLKGKTFCFVDPNSTSGYVIPRIILAANGVDPDKDFKASQNAGSHNNVAIAVYKGDCDAGVTFIDVLVDKAANLAATYPDIADKVSAFAVTDRIPNDGVQFVKNIDPAIKAATIDGLLKMADDPGGNAVLRGLYTVNGFQKVDANYYDDFVAVLKKAGIDPAALVK